MLSPVAHMARSCERIVVCGEDCPEDCLIRHPAGGPRGIARAEQVRGMGAEGARDEKEQWCGGFAGLEVCVCTRGDL
jgi:hypothetical protein